MKDRILVFTWERDLDGKLVIREGVEFRALRNKDGRFNSQFQYFVGNAVQDVLNGVAEKISIERGRIPDA